MKGEGVKKVYGKVTEDTPLKDKYNFFGCLVARRE